MIEIPFLCQHCSAPECTSKAGSRLRVGAFVVARNESPSNVCATLESLGRQTLKPRVVFVDDGNTGETLDAARGLAEIVSLPRHDESYVGKPEIADVFNAGFRALTGCQFVLVSGADTQFPSGYMEAVVREMLRERAVVASGYPQGERRPHEPRGTGRVIDMEWFGGLPTFGYPQNFGFEAYHVLVARCQDRNVGVYDDTFTMREMRLPPMKARDWGRGMKANNYWWAYALGRALVAARRPRVAFQLFRGFLSDTPANPGTERVPVLQRRQAKKRLLRALKIERLAKRTLVMSKYLPAKKLHEVGVRITGDIDSPFDVGLDLLNDWLDAAEELSTSPPILFIPYFCGGALQKTLKELGRNAIVGVHGHEHIRFSNMGTAETAAHLRESAGFSPWFRFPFLDFGRESLRAVCECFRYDSSFVGGFMEPFALGKMQEFPITPPTDTAIRDSVDGLKWAASFARMIGSPGHFRTFLFHPNTFSVELMRGIIRERDRLQG